MKASVSLRGEPSEPFEVGNGLKQDCILISTQFLIFLSMVLSDAFIDSIKELWVQSRPEANLFNVSQVKSLNSNVLVDYLMFVDDTDFLARSHQNLQEIITCFLKYPKEFELKNSRNPKLYTNPHWDLMILAKTCGERGTNSSKQI